MVVRVIEGLGHSVREIARRQSMLLVACTLSYHSIFFCKENGMGDTGNGGHQKYRV